MGMKAAIVLIVALLCSGCFVVDEIEEGRKIMAAHSPNPEPEAEKSPTRASGGTKSARQRLAEYYAEQRAKAARSAESTDPADAVGRCRIRGTTHFLRRSDCQVRGGTFL